MALSMLDQPDVMPLCLVTADPNVKPRRKGGVLICDSLQWKEEDQGWMRNVNKWEEFLLS